jgi:hypothetical protein
VASAAWSALASSASEEARTAAVGRPWPTSWANVGPALESRRQHLGQDLRHPRQAILLDPLRRREDTGARGKVRPHRRGDLTEDVGGHRDHDRLRAGHDRPEVTVELDRLGEAHPGQVPAVLGSRAQDCEELGLEHPQTRREPRARGLDGQRRAPGSSADDREALGGHR